MTAITKQKMGTHAGVPYSIQITKVNGVYFPRIVILLDEPVIIDSCEIGLYFGVSAFKFNPFSIAEGMAIGAIDAGSSSNHQASIAYIEQKLAGEREILALYKADRKALKPLTEEFKNRTLLAVENAKLLQAIIKNHYMSERYAGRTSTEY